VAKRSNGLRTSVLVDREGILIEVGNETLLVVEHGRVEDNLFDLLLEDKSPLSFVSGACPPCAACPVPCGAACTGSCLEVQTVRRSWRFPGAGAAAGAV